MNVISSTAPTIAGTANDDIILGFQQAGMLLAPADPDAPRADPISYDTVVNAGDGYDLVYGDVRDLFVITAAIRNGTRNLARHLDETLYWSTGEDPNFGNDAVPHTTAFVETSTGQNEWFAVTVGAGQTLTVDVDYSAFLLRSGANVLAEIFNEAGALVASNDGGFPPAEGLGGDGADPYIAYTPTTAGVFYILIRPGGARTGTVFDANETVVLNLSVTGHANSGGVLAGRDTLNGEAGNDRLFGQGGDDVLNGGEGHDVLAGGSGVDTLTGDSGSDALHGGAGTDYLIGGDGDDSINGGLGADYLLGGAGFDSFDFAGVADSPVTGGFDAIADFSSATDRIRFLFDPGRPFIQRTDGPSFVYFDQLGLGTAGYDGVIQVNGLVQAIDVNWQSPSGTAQLGVYLYGRDGAADDLQGAGGADILVGFAGADTLTGGFGGDQLYGGAGADTFLWRQGEDSSIAAFDVIADFATGVDRIDLVGAARYSNMALTQLGGSTFIYYSLPGAAAYQGVIQVVGPMTGADLILGAGVGATIYGTAAPEVLYGTTGPDIILAGDGADRIVGGAGADSLFGGSGADVFDIDAVSESTASVWDTIQDFQVGVDKIDLRDVAASAVLSTFGGNTFVYFDSNGAGGYRGLVIANGVTLTQADVLVTGESGAPDSAEHAAWSNSEPPSALAALPLDLGSPPILFAAFEADLA